MKIYQSLLCLLLLGLCLTSCKDTVVDPIDYPNPLENPDPITVPECEDVIEDISAANNKFGFDVFQNINALEESDGQNLFISPLSINFALGMAYNGVVDQTAEEMQTILKLQEFALTESNQGYKCLIDVLDAIQLTDDQVQMDIANSIWYNQDIAIKSDFLDTNEFYFDGQVKETDFNNPAAKDIIHEWISDNTNGKITEIIDQIPADIVMYLINAIYFNGNWKYEFDEEATNDKTFYKENGDVVATPFMSQQETFNFFETDNFRAVELPYGDDKFSMSVLVPKGNYQVNDLITELNAENWDEWMNAFKPQEMVLNFPKFTLEYKVLLNDALKAMGMQRAFRQDAQFDKINDNIPLWISRVLHKTFIEVNEVGTEAAAVTVVEIVTESAVIDGPPVFSADRPFVYVIRDKVEGSIAFVGKMVDPSL